ncbi:MAG: aldehyde dehydrogenase family protein [Fimbriimonadaceae bacterium]
MRHGELLIDGHFLGGPCDQAIPKSVVTSPFDGSTVGTVADCDARHFDWAVDAAVHSFLRWRHSALEERRSLLRRIAERVRADREDLAQLLVHEVGKPILWAQAEVDRTATTFELAAHALDDPHYRPGGHELDAIPYAELDRRAANYRAGVRREPLGPVLAITPYNWPFNLAAHKIAPALAVGATVVLKGSSQAALSTLALGRHIHECGCPSGVLNAVAADGETTSAFVADPRFGLVSFTGSPSVGWAIRRQVIDKPVLLELGGDGFAVIHGDADLDRAVERVVWGGFGYAGQICIAVQHVLVEASVYDEVRERLIRATQDCPYGDPGDVHTVCGPLISESAANKVQEWTDEAVAFGAKLLVGGTRSGAMIAPTLIENVPKAARLYRNEVFGPVITLQAYTSTSGAIDRINTSPYGIHLGVFTQDENVVTAFDDGTLMGGVVWNDVPTVRFDALPYGGRGQSGVGREGIPWSLEEFTALRTLVKYQPPV